MVFLKKYGAGIAAAAAVLLIAAGWIIAWRRIGNAMHDAEYAEAFSSFTYDGVYYSRVTDSELSARYGEQRTPEGIAGDRLGSVPFVTPRGTENGTLYAVGTADVTDGRYPLTVLQCGAGWFAYELSGFVSLGESPSISEVCGAYGLTEPESIVSVSIADADGSFLAELTDSASIRAFYEKLIRLGDDIGEEGQARAYYEAYIDKYGEDDGVTFADGSVQFANEEARTRAMTLWAEGVRLVTIRLINGFWLRDLVYAPVPGIFSVYGNYRFEDALCE